MEKTSRFEVIIGVLALVSIIVVAVETLTDLSSVGLIFAYGIDLIICAVFGWDFIHRLKQEGDKRKFWIHNGYELLAMIPAVLLYFAGVIPVISIALRSLRLFRVIRIVIVISRARRVFSASGNFIFRSNLITMFAVTFSLVFIGAFAVFLLESDKAGAQITSFFDAVWWSLSTVTTVAYGDIVPNTTAGRIIGMVLMIVGVGVMAGLISQVSATLVESRISRKNKGSDLKTKIVEELKNKLDKIEDLSEANVALMVKMINTLNKGG